MVVSFVLRLTGSALSDGQLVGEVEHVGSGARARFRSADELQRWCTAAAGATPVVPLTRTEIVLDEPAPVEPA